MTLTVLAAVYNPIAYDGRVQRECEALSEIAHVELLCPCGPKVPDGLAFRVTAVEIPVSGTVRRHLMFATAVMAHARRMRPDIIHAHDFFMAGPGVFASMATGARLVYDSHELIIPESREVRSMRARFWYQMERWAVARADLVISANDERSRLMHRHYGLRKAPLVVRNIPPISKDDNVSDTGSFKQSPDERLCVYQGDVSLKRGLGQLLEAVPRLPAHVRLLLVGGGPDEGAVRDQVARLRIEDRVTLLGKVARARLHGVLRACDVGLITYPFSGLNNIYCAPNKIFEYAQAGLPVVATAQPPLETLLDTYRIGVTFGQLDGPGVIAERIAHVIENGSKYRAGIERFLQENTWDAEAERLRAAVSAVAAARCA